jgi:hypothetical protein
MFDYFERRRNAREAIYDSFAYANYIIAIGATCPDEGAVRSAFLRLQAVGNIIAQQHGFTSMRGLIRLPKISDQNSFIIIVFAVIIVLIAVALEVARIL